MPAYDAFATAAVNVAFPTWFYSAWAIAGLHPLVKAQLSPDQRAAGTRGRGRRRGVVLVGEDAVGEVEGPKGAAGAGVAAERALCLIVREGRAGGCADECAAGDRCRRRASATLLYGASDLRRSFAATSVAVFTMATALAAGAPRSPATAVARLLAGCPGTCCVR